MARKFFYVCAGLFLLTLTYHLGARSATAQAPGNPIVAVIPGTCPENTSVVVTANGDLWGANYCASSWTHIGNVFSGGPTPAKQETWGGLKARYR
jgi:hypothetical protein